MDKPREIWSHVIGEGPLVALAIHDGHDIRAELRQFIAIDEEIRKREEDPYTGEWTKFFPTQFVVKGLVLNLTLTGHGRKQFIQILRMPGA